MTRIIPQYETNTRKSLPNWINKEEIVKAGNNTKLPLKKQASKEESKIVVSYFCTPCKKVIAVEDKSIIQQKTLAKKANKEFKPYCPNCGNELKVYKETGLKQSVANLQSINESKVVDVLRKEGTYNTFVDRRIVYETVEKLARYASKLGMTGCVARYIKSEHAKGSSNKISTFDEIECSLEWMYGRKQKGRATASVKIDPAGKFEFPRVFKVASGMEYPFEEKYIRMLEKDAAMFQSLPKRKKSDIPTFRKPDPTRFRVTSSVKVGDFKRESASLVTPELKQFAIDYFTKASSLKKKSSSWDDLLLEEKLPNGYVVQLLGYLDSNWEDTQGHGYAVHVKPSEDEEDDIKVYWSRAMNGYDYEKGKFLDKAQAKFWDAVEKYKSTSSKKNKTREDRARSRALDEFADEQALSEEL